MAKTLAVSDPDLSSHFLGTPGIPPALEQDDLHIWCIAVDGCPAAELSRLEFLLSADEVERAARFHFEGDRRRYIAGRGLLRQLLGQYLECDPASLRFQYSTEGKPALRGAEGEPPLHFNLSHSQGVVLYGFTRAGAIGVDIEHIVPFGELDDVAARHFSPEELADLYRTDATDRLGAFYRCWTRKESWIKAIGSGLSCPLQTFSVSLLPGEEARLRALAGDPTAPSRWTMYDLQALPGAGVAEVAAAAAVEGRIGRIQQWNQVYENEFLLH